MRPPVAIFACGALGVLGLAIANVHGARLEPDRVAVFLWVLLFYGLIRGLQTPRRLLMVWNVGVLAAICGAEPTALVSWILVALLLVQLVALCALEYEITTARP